MKRIFIVITLVLFSLGTVFAEEAILIDFSKLKADIIPDQDDKPTQNQATMMDFAGKIIGGTYTDDQKAQMKTSLAIKNWEVVLNSSARTITNEILSHTEEAPSKQWDTVMGVRIHFPLGSFNASARVVPPFEIPAFEPQAEIDEDGNITPGESNGITGPSRFEAPAGDEGKVDNTQPAYGVVKNVGTIKSVAANVYGLNFPHSLSAILVDDKGAEKTVFLGYLNYDGWGQLQWDNPAYIQEVRNRDLRLYPLYPQSTPFVKFGGFLVQRDGAREGGDFVGYFKDVKIIYDKAVLDTDRDIDDEAVWNIIYARETDRKAFEMTKFGQKQVIRYLDSQKQAAESEFTPTATE